MSALLESPRALTRLVDECLELLGGGAYGRPNGNVRRITMKQITFMRKVQRVCTVLLESERYVEIGRQDENPSETHCRDRGVG